MTVDLALTSNRDYKPGASFLKRGVWLLVCELVFANPLVIPYRLKVALLRTFGAQMGSNVIIKPRARVKYPWRLSVADNCWIGEAAWIDNMEDVAIGANAVVSQGAYLCTGNHDWSDPGMGLMPSPIHIGEGAWVGAFARVGPGVTLAPGSVLVLGAVALRDTEPMGIYSGNPASYVRTRHVRERAGASTSAITARR